MDTVVALLSAVARALRGLFDMALMAVGVAPTSIPLTESVSLPSDDPREHQRSRRFASADSLLDDGHFRRDDVSMIPMPGYVDLSGSPWGCSDGLGNRDDR